MTPYLDTVDSFYSNHEVKTNTKQMNATTKNNEKIGKISVILIIAYVVYLVSRWVT